MTTNGEAREAEIASGDTGARKEAAAATTPRASRTGKVLGGVAALLILAGAAYYFVGHRAGTEVATNSGAERPADGPTVADNPRVPDGGEKPAPSTSSAQERTSQPQSSQPGEPQQSASTSPPPAATPPAETPAASPATAATAPAPPPSATAQGGVANSQPSENEQPADSAKAASGVGSGATQASPSAEPSMRDQPAALPDQAAAAPKKENMLVVMRGPANVRSAPGKRGRVIGTAPKDSTVKELDRSGNWVQVETDAGTGWINAALLGSAASR